MDYRRETPLLRIPGDPCRTRRGRTASQIVVVSVAVALVVVPVLISEAPREVARWFAAAATEAQLNGQLDAAIARQGRAIAWQPNAAQLYAQRAAMELQAKQWEAVLRDCDRVRQSDPENPDVGSLRIAALQHLGRHAEAIAEAKRMVRRCDKDDAAKRAQALNTLAYTRAVANRELPEGLADANQAIQLVGNRASTLDPEGFLWFGRAGSARRNENRELALKCLNEALRHAEKHYAENKNRSLALALVPPLALDYMRRAALLKAQVSGILYQRAELLDELDRPAEAKRDRKRLKDLNKDGNVSMTVPLTLDEAMGILEIEAMYLDTRGFLYYRLDRQVAARRDLDQAIRMSDAGAQAYPWLLEARRHFIYDLRLLTANQKLLEENLATLLYHRMLTLQALGEKQLADKDRQRIVQLGYAPSDALN